MHSRLSTVGGTPQLQLNLSRDAPNRRMFKHLKKNPNIPIGLAHNSLYRQAWPHDPKSMHNEAVLLLSQGHADQALELLKTAVSIRPDMGNVWADLAVAHTHLNNPQGALRCLKARMQVCCCQYKTQSQLKL